MRRILFTLSVICMVVAVVGTAAVIPQASSAGATQTQTKTPTPWVSLTPFPTPMTADLIYIGEFKILTRTVTIRDAPSINGKAVGSAYPGSTWVFDFPPYQNPATGDVWWKVASQEYWMALKYNGRYFSTWHE